MITHRRICWPNPDATCLEGGCLHCNDHPFRSMRSLHAYTAHAGQLPHRGRGSEDGTHALNYGWVHGFPNVESRDATTCGG